MNICAPKYSPPNKEFSRKKPLSCYSDRMLMKLTQLKDNTVYPKKKMTPEERKKIVDNLSSHLKSQCKDETEICWTNVLVKKERHKQKIVRKYFLPQSPDEWSKTNSNEWLTSTDIEEVMNNYCQWKKPSFLFLGTPPIDFAEEDEINNGSCIDPSVCDVDVDKWIRNKNTDIGVIFNLDRHDGPGTHWVAAFVRLAPIKHQGVFYFDSFGFPPPLPIQKQFLERVVTKLNRKAQFPVEIQINDKRHQFGTTECGTFCLHFIISMLLSKKADIRSYNNGNDLSDKFIQEFRNKFWRHKSLTPLEFPLKRKEHSKKIFHGSGGTPVRRIVKTKSGTRKQKSF